MFLLRSAFWLGLAFVLLAPPGTDITSTATALRDQAVATGIEAGSGFIAEQILSSQTSSLPSVVLPMQDSSTVPDVFPRTRPAAMG